MKVVFVCLMLLKVDFLVCCLFFTGSGFSNVFLLFDFF